MSNTQNDQEIREPFRTINIGSKFLPLPKQNLKVKELMTDRQNNQDITGIVQNRRHRNQVSFQDKAESKVMSN